ncbi:MAG: hypothetical protein V1798_02525 [Pseudomonadota bacterium]
MIPTAYNDDFESGLARGLRYTGLMLRSARIFGWLMLVPFLVGVSDVWAAAGYAAGTGVQQTDATGTAVGSTDLANMRARAQAIQDPNYTRAQQGTSRMNTGSVALAQGRTAQGGTTQATANRYQIDLWGLMPWSGSALHTWGELIANWFLLPNLNIFGRRFGINFTTNRSLLSQLQNILNRTTGAVRVPGVDCPDCDAQKKTKTALDAYRQQLQDALDLVTRAQNQQQQQQQQQQS